MDATGRAAVVEQFHGRFAVLGPSNHFTHDHVITFDDSDPSRAKGLVNAHAEVVRNGRPLLTSLRYHDEYRHEDGCWRFHVRTLSFFYYVEPRRYQEVMLGALRNEARNMFARKQKFLGWLHAERDQRDEAGSGKEDAGAGKENARVGKEKVSKEGAGVKEKVHAD